jgi:pantoate--beta-alanine ligase
VEIIRIPRIMQDTCKKHRLKGRSIGLVPTMGALHEGHMSLVKRARMENDVIAASIFVNPLQFGPSEDLEKYPRDLDSDIGKLRDLEVDVLLLPDESLVYPKGFSTHVEVEEISRKLCGSFRPGHFRGVATIVAKLFNVATPSRAYFGQKDFQQTVVIKKMAKDLNFDTEIVVCPTIREHDGLAMSSRNLYLDAAQRNAATSLYRSVCAGANALAAGERSASRIKGMMNSVLSAEELITGIDYASVYDPETLDEVAEIHGEMLLAVAARLGETRLIDNTLVNTD